MIQQMLKRGTLSMTDEVFTIIAAMVLSDMEGNGIQSVSSRITDEFIRLIGKKSSQKGIDIKKEKNGIILTVKISIQYGLSILDITHKLQKYIKQEIELLTGVEVIAVNVLIEDSYV